LLATVDPKSTLGENKNRFVVFVLGILKNEKLAEAAMID